MAVDAHLALNATHMSAWQTVTRDTKIAAMVSSLSAGYGLLILGSIMMMTFIARWIMNTAKFAQWETINKAGFWNKTEAKNNYLWNARKLLLDGFTKAPKGYIMETDMDPVLLLSPEYANEIRGDPRLSFKDLLAKDLLGHLYTFRVFNAHGRYDQMVNDLVRKRLTQSLGLVTEELSDEMALVLSQQWTEETDWHAISLKETMLVIVAQISSRVFLGPDLCRDPEWLRITIEFTVNIFLAIAAMKKYHPAVHQIAQWFVPEARKVRNAMNEACRIMQPVVDGRRKELEAGQKGDTKRTHGDTIQWMLESTAWKGDEIALSQLSISMAAIHTTGDLITQVIYDLCQHPELIKPLRSEIIEVIGKEGFKRTALYKLKLMDSVLKETQRLKAISMVSMRRVATETITLKDGLRIPKGTIVGVSGHWSWDENFFENPDQYDGYRFLKLSENPETAQMSHFVATSPQHVAFGHGTHACPGRFFASNEAKITLVHILLKYDFQLDTSVPLPRVWSLGFAMNSEHGKQILVRRRQEEIDLDCGTA